MNKISIVNCSHKNTQQIDEIIETFKNYFKAHNIETLTIPLNALRVVSCTECKICMQVPGDVPEKCFHHDNMDDIIDILEDCNAYVFLSDTNSLFSANEVFQKFSKRLAAYYYWPYGTKSSVHRKKTHDKTSVLVNYNTTINLFSSTFGVALDQLKTNSIAIGAEPVSTLTLKPTKNLSNFIGENKSQIEQSAQALIKSLQAAS